MNYRSALLVGSILFQLHNNAAFAQGKDSSIIRSDETLSLKKRDYTYFASDRFCEDNKYDIFKIASYEVAPFAIIVRGHFEITGYPDQKRAVIKILNASNNELVGIYNTNSYTGNYLLVLVPNVKYIFKIEVAGFGIYEETVEVPLKTDYEVCKQEFKIRLNDQGKPVYLLYNLFIDGEDKSFYLSAKSDTSHSAAELPIEDLSKKQDRKTSPNIDELVKKQLQEEAKKPVEALRAFKNKNYETALSYYADVIRQNPEDPLFNYYYGVCLLKSEKNKAKATNSLQLASRYKEVPYDVFLYLGKAYHLSYLFQDATLALQEYKKRATPQEVQENKILQLIKNCKDGATLLSEQVNIEMISRAACTDENMLSKYNSDLVNEKLKYKTDFFNSAIDKKKGSRLLMCNNGKREIVYVSYGEKEQSGTDLYKSILLPNGNYGGAQPLEEINTPSDENYPYITKDGNTLYFSSTGYNSMGGYDIFKCTRKDSLSAWSKPVNMGFPINSTYDDILFVSDSSGRYGSFCSNRKDNKMEFLQIKIPEKSNEYSIIKGRLVTGDSVGEKNAFVSVYNSATGEIAGTFKTNAVNGSYLVMLASGTKYQMIVEVDGYPESISTFEIPQKRNEYVMKQEIVLKKDLAQKSIRIFNYFSEVEAAKINLDEPIQNTASKTNNPKAGEDKLEKVKKPARSAAEMKTDEEDLAKAKHWYELELYQQAAALYEEVRKRMDPDALSLYYHGLSLYNSQKDKKECIKILELAAGGKSVPEDVFYYLAKANQLSYKFSSAINYYKKFMSLSKPSEAQRLMLEREIECCNAGIKLVNEPVMMEVYEKKHVGVENIQSSLALLGSGAKILVMPDDMQSGTDKKKNYRSLFFLSPDKNTALYSSYGDNDLNGKDIYQIKKLSNGKWSTPMRIVSVNSSFDEEYPSLSKDGKTLYFSSKGFNNMGGYDIFKSTWDEAGQLWSQPVNLGSPVNSPYEDIFFLE